MATLVLDSVFGFLQDSGLAGSPGEAAALLMEGLVRINHLPVRNPRTHLVSGGDVVSVAGDTGTRCSRPRPKCGAHNRCAPGEREAHWSA